MAKKYPTISIVIPTLNAGEILDKCLSFVAAQDYPKENIEIIIADGGSDDNTKEVAQKYGAKVYHNKLKTAEAGKAVGVKKAKNEIILLLDSDNFIPDTTWMKRMIEPFSDAEVLGSEPLHFDYRSTDGYLTRYTALLGMGDPMVYFTGNYDRYSHLSGRWTMLKVPFEDKGDWLKLTLLPKRVPTIGANGFMIRKSFFSDHKLGDYLFDIDLIALAVEKKPLKFAKVKVGLVHVFSGTMSTFIRKRRRMVKDYLFYQKSGLRTYPWSDTNKFGLAMFVIYTVLTVPTILQSIKGFIKKPDSSWFIHPIACWVTLWVYGTEFIKAKIWGAEIETRKNWKQTS